MKAEKKYIKQISEVLEEDEVINMDEEGEVSNPNEIENPFHPRLDVGEILAKRFRGLPKHKPFANIESL